MICQHFVLTALLLFHSRTLPSPSMYTVWRFIGGLGTDRVGQDAVPAALYVVYFGRKPRMSLVMSFFEPIQIDSRYLCQLE